mmetsp:Transcript_28663/g.68352  ORF Transcript_28663/g.68352 Transcript_28663/m.68352 type:complete len:858 (+) Transcript_28663:875-3448(+)
MKLLLATCLALLGLRPEAAGIQKVLWQETKEIAERHSSDIRGFFASANAANAAENSVDTGAGEAEDASLPEDEDLGGDVQQQFHDVNGEEVAADIDADVARDEADPRVYLEQRREMGILSGSDDEYEFEYSDDEEEGSQPLSQLSQESNKARQIVDSTSSSNGDAFAPGQENEGNSNSPRRVSVSPRAGGNLKRDAGEAGLDNNNSERKPRAAEDDGDLKPAAVDEPAALDKKPAAAVDSSGESPVLRRRPMGASPGRAPGGNLRGSLLKAINEDELLQMDGITPAQKEFRELLRARNVNDLPDEFRDHHDEVRALYTASDGYCELLEIADRDDIVPYDSLGRVDNIRLALVANFPPWKNFLKRLQEGTFHRLLNGALEIAGDIASYAFKEQCIKAGENLVTDALVYVAKFVHPDIPDGLPRMVARLIVRGTTAYMNRSPLARPSTLHSDRSTRHIYELECSLTDDPSRSIAREVIDHMPNAVGVVVLGEPAYETVVEGGGALQSGWFEDKGMCVRPQVGSGHDPHYQRIGIGWSLQRELLKVNNDVVDVLREAVGPGIHIPRITTRDDLEAMTSFTIASQASQRTVYDENVGEEFLESLDRSIQDELDASDRKEVIEYLQQEARRSSLSSGKLKGTKRSLEAAARNGNMSTVGRYYCRQCKSEGGCRYFAYGAGCTRCGHTYGFTHIVNNEGDYVRNPIRGYCSTDGCGCTGQLGTNHNCLPVDGHGNARERNENEGWSDGPTRKLDTATCPPNFVLKHETSIIVKRTEVGTNSWTVLDSYNSWANDVLAIASRMHINDVIRTSSFLVKGLTRGYVPSLKGQRTIRDALRNLMDENLNGGFRIGSYVYESIGIVRN